MHKLLQLVLHASRHQTLCTKYNKIFVIFESKQLETLLVQRIIESFHVWPPNDNEIALSIRLSYAVSNTLLHAMPNVQHSVAYRRGEHMTGR